MPGLDVSEAFDESFFDQFNLVRRLEGVNNSGRSVTVDTVTEGLYGVVTMASPNDLERLPEADISKKSIIVVTQNRLQLSSAGPDADHTYKADVVYWAGDYYQVTTVEDYSRYGEGYIWALCQATDFVLAPPTPNPVT